MKALAEADQKNLYVNGVLSGEETFAKIKELQVQLIQLMQRGGMVLHGWVSKNSDSLQGPKSSMHIFDSQQGVVKTLSMLWCPKSAHPAFFLHSR